MIETLSKITLKRTLRVTMIPESAFNLKCIFEKKNNNKIQELFFKMTYNNKKITYIIF